MSSVVQDEALRLKDGTDLKGNIAAWSADGSGFYFDLDGDDSANKVRWILMSDVVGIQ